MDSSSHPRLGSIQKFRVARKFLFATALVFAVGFDSACATGSEVAAGDVAPAGKGDGGGEIANGDAATEARLAEEQWERVDVAAMTPALPIPGGAATAPTAVVEEVPFAAGVALLTPEVREHLDRLATRLSAGSAGSAGSVESARCRLDLRSPVAESDTRLIEDRAAAVRRYLSGEKGIAETSITVGAAIDLSPGGATADDCVVVALLD